MNDTDQGEPPANGVSIVMAVKDNLEWTRKGIESIRANTSHPYELITVDNGSQPETTEYLAAASDQFIRNDENLGCSGAWNQGIRAARMPLVCIVNNDIEVPTGWLERLVAFLLEQDFLMVSPSIREGPFDYDLDAYNEDFAARLDHRAFPSELRGIAMLARRDLFDEIGLYDEGYKVGGYEDEDMFMTIRSVGGDVATTSTVLLHHYGSKTLSVEQRSNSFDFSAANRAHFMRKWRHRYFWRKFHRSRMKWRRAGIRRRFDVTY